MTPDTPTPPKTDPDFNITVPYFSIPDETILRMLMEREHAAVEVVHAKMKGFMEPGMALVGADNQPIPAVGQQLNQRCTAWMKELIALPTLVDEWAGAQSVGSKEGSLSTTSWAIAYLVYQEFARVLAHRKLQGFTHTTDFALVAGLNALHHGRRPVEAYIQGYSAKTTTPEGVPVLESPDALHADLERLQGALMSFLVVKELVNTPEAGAAVTLTMEGVRLLEHLMAVMGCTESMSAQGPAIAQEVMGRLKTETRSASGIMADLGTTTPTKGH